jgi:hypothetical protein
MFKFLGFLFILGLFGFLVIGVFLGRVIRFFGTEDRGRPHKKQADNKSQSSKSPDVSQKKFSKNEGEYISYEEVKDDK